MKNSLIFLVFTLTSGFTFCQPEDNYRGCLDSLYIPETCTPCGDTANDAWVIYFPCIPDSLNISIYNRWGQTIFTSDKYDFRWTGRDNNDVTLSTGTYFYHLNFTYLGEEKTFTGHVTLIR